MAGKCAICYVGDSRFNPYACFSAASVRAHPENSDFDVYLCSDGFTDAERAFMEQLSIRPVLFDPATLLITGSPTCHSLPPSCYYRLSFDHFLPPGYDRVIYLDGDTFIAGSLQILAQLDLEERPLAAVRGLGTAGCRSEKDKQALKDYWKSIGIAGDPTFNSGLMVIDVPRWRQGDLGQRTLDQVNQQQTIDDEEALNIVLQDDWLELSSRWNFPSFQLALNVESSLQPVVYHYMHGPKPWHRSWTHEPVHRRRYQAFFAESPWPEAARSWPQDFKCRPFLRKKLRQLTRKCTGQAPGTVYQDTGRLGEAQRRAVVTLHNEGVAEDRFADQRQGFSELTPMT